MIPLLPVATLVSIQWAFIGNNHCFTIGLQNWTWINCKVINILLYYYRSIVPEKNQSKSGLRFSRRDVMKPFSVELKAFDCGLYNDNNNNNNYNQIKVEQLSKEELPTNA